MRRITFISLIVVVLVGCVRARTIPDDTLSDIFRDMYIVNAYVDENPSMFGGRQSSVNSYGRTNVAVNMNNAMDSINIYEPILRRYGYRTRDFVHTLAGFSKRKSSKVSDVVEVAIEKLNAQLAKYTAEISLIESLDSAAYAFSADTIASGVSLSAHAIKDTALMTLKYTADEGHYRIEYSYLLDTLDKNYGVRATHYLRDSVGMVVEQETYTLFRGARTRRALELTSSGQATELELKFNNYTGDKIKRPYLDVDSISVVHYPPKDVARDEYLKKLVNYNASDYIFEPEIETEETTTEDTEIAEDKTLNP